MHAWKITDLSAWNVQDVLSEYVISEKKRRKNEEKKTALFSKATAVWLETLLLSACSYFTTVRCALHPCLIQFEWNSSRWSAAQFHQSLTVVTRKACHPGHDRWLVDCSLAAYLSLLYRPLSRVDWVPVSIQCVCGCDWSNGYRCHGWLKPSNFLPAR